MSLNRFLIQSGVPAVLILGLVSCAPDQRPRQDHFRLQPPKILHSDQSALSWVDVSSQAQPQLQAEDQIVFAPDASAKGVGLSIEVACMGANQRTATRRSHWREPRQIPISLLLPDDTPSLMPEMSASLQCRFEFTASNSIGSKHRFQLPLSEVRGIGSRHGLHLRQDNRVLESDRRSPLLITGDSFSRTFVVSDEPLDTLLMTCENFSLRQSVASGQPIALSALRFDKAQVTHRGPSIAEYSRPFCQVSASYLGQRTGVSDFFWLELPAAMPTVTSVAATDASDGKTPLEIAQVTLTNPHTFPLNFWFRDKELPRFKILAVVPGQTDLGFEVQSSLAYELAASSAGVILSRQTDGTSLTLEAGQTATLRLFLPVVHGCNMIEFLGGSGALKSELGLWLVPEHGFELSLRQDFAGAPGDQAQIARITLIGSDPIWLGHQSWGKQALPPKELPRGRIRSGCQFREFPGLRRSTR